MKDEQPRTRFETLLLPLMSDTYNLARWLMKNQEDAEDMVQEFYLRAFRFFASFQDPADRAKHMLHRVRNSGPETKASAIGLGSRRDRRYITVASDQPCSKSDGRIGARGDRSIAGRFSRSSGSTGIRGFILQGNL